MADEEQFTPPPSIVNGNVLAWRVSQLEAWNSNMQKEVDMLTRTVTTLEAEFESHKEVAEEIKAKLTSVNNWLRGLVGSLILALVLLILNLIFGTRLQMPH